MYIFLLICLYIMVSSGILYIYIFIYLYKSAYMHTHLHLVVPVRIGCKRWTWNTDGELSCFYARHVDFGCRVNMIAHSRLSKRKSIYIIRKFTCTYAQHVYRREHCNFISSPEASPPYDYCHCRPLSPNDLFQNICKLCVSIRLLVSVLLA